MRFDFIVDEDLDVHLMEVNMSPNLNPTPHVRKNRLMFQQVIHDTLKLVGVGSYLR